MSLDEEAFRWLPDVVRPPTALRCVYCGAAGAFPHAMSLRFCSEPFHLHRCPDCASLVYDMARVAGRPPLQIPQRFYDVHARYYLETGYNIEFIVLCALAALGDIPDESLHEYIFFDVGAGIGLGAHFVRDSFGADVLAIEPAPTGTAGQAIFDIDLRPNYFESLPPEVMERLRTKPCLVHLNAVVEHLVDPRTVLEELVAALDVRTLAIVVPDAACVDTTQPLLEALETLSPNEHLHLPTRDGVVALMRHLGFTHHAETVIGSLLVCIGARSPVAIPAPRTVALAAQSFLERLERHPHPDVAGGAVARLLPQAVLGGRHDVVDRLRGRFASGLRPEALLAELEADPDFLRVPLHLAPTGYWLAADAAAAGRLTEALAYLDVVDSFADRFGAVFPQYTSQPQQYKWEARLYRAELLVRAGDVAQARAVLVGMRAAGADALGGPNADQLARAGAALAALRGGADENPEQSSRENAAVTSGLDAR